VPISDNANPNGTGQTLKFSDSTQQAIIFGPESTSANNNAERIIIQGAPGFTGTTGEGGDVYLWAGPGGSTNGSGGDIKVRAGQGSGTGDGGYLNFQAGDSGTGTGGYINIESGESATPGSGGDITLDARSGGEIIVRTDNGSTNKNWTFDKDGDLTLPLNTVISETASSPGLLKRKYSGTFVLDPTWFVTNAANLIQTTTPLSIIQSTDLEVFGAFCFEFTGYFVPPTSANYTFKAHADETFIFWIGSKALSGYTYANKDMYGDYNGTSPEQQTQSFTIALTAGQFYPIRLQWGNSAGWGQLDVFTWANDAGQADTTNFNGHIYTANTGSAKISVNDNKSIILSTDNATVNNWTFGANGGLTLPEGSVISETVTTTVITPPGAAVGQSLVIRPTAATNLSASGYIVPGVNLTITLTNGTITVYDGDPITYTITGTTAEQLGILSLTGTFPAFSPIDSVPQSTTLVLPIPEYTSANTFTLTVGGTNPFAASFITVTDNNVIETSHIHLVSGDPVTTDIYLGDDDQYVKIEKNGGDVVVGTNANTQRWVFGTDGDLTIPGNIQKATDASLVVGVPPLAENVVIYAVDYDAPVWRMFVNATAYPNLPVIPVGTPVTTGWGTPVTATVQEVIDDRVNGSVWVFIFDQDVLTGFTGGQGYTATFGTELQTWTFGTDGSLTFPDGEVQPTAYAGGQGHMMMIDTNRTDTYTEIGSADKPFKTVAAAFAACAIANPTGVLPYTFVFMGCNISENVNLNAFNFNFVTLATTCRTVFTGTFTAGNSELRQLVIRNIEFANTFTLLGDTTATQFANTSIYNASFSGAVNITTVNNVAFYEVAFFGVVTIKNINYMYINGAQFNTDLTFTVDDSGATVIPSNGIAPMIVIAFNFIANNVYMTKVGAGSGFLVFQPHMARMGLAASTYNIPAGFVFQPQGCALRGTYVNSGSMTLRNTSTDDAPHGVAPAWTGVIGGDRVIADLPPTTSHGAIGDRVGMIAVSAGYLYICTANWTDGVADIWSRTAITATSW
jgi:hypothetical protein